MVPVRCLPASLLVYWLLLSCSWMADVLGLQCLFRRRDRSPRRWSSATDASPRAPFGLASSSTTSSTHNAQTGSSGKGNSRGPRAKVLYQKVLRSNDDDFLLALVEFLEQFRLPKNLAMPYETTLVASDEDGCGSDGGRTAEPTVVEWDSPLSPHADATRLRVQVVAIATDSDGGGRSAPAPAGSYPMVMVAVQKAAASASTSAAPMPPMVRGLFDDCEARILKSLDRGLEDFAADYATRATRDANRRRREEQTVLTELLEEVEDGDGETGGSGSSPVDAGDAAAFTTGFDKPNLDDAINADIVEEKSTAVVPPSDAQREAVLRTMSRKAVDTVVKPSDLDEGQEHEEFAVEAARRAAKQQQEASLNDYAVRAAKQAASRGRKANSLASEPSGAAQAASVTGSTLGSRSVETAASTGGPMHLSNLRSPMLDNKRFISISKPGELAARRERAKSKTSTPMRSMGDQQVHKKAPNMSNEKPRPPAVDVDSMTPTEKNLDTFSDSMTAKTIKATHRSSIDVQGAGMPVDTETNGDAASHTRGSDLPTVTSVAGTNEQVDTDPGINLKKPIDDVEAEVQRTTEEALAEMSGEDISPEDLLRDVIRFGEKSEQVFASSAFEKAKELLREQHQKREEQLQSKVVDKVPGLLDELAPDTPGLTPEEELRRMFEAGEKMADNMIEKVATKSTLSEVDERMVDDLISSRDSDISSYARRLDEDLAELAVRINKSPSEEFDGPRKNPLFDVFSGPEVYNPNVDPETAENWPGALPRFRQSHLPKDLRAAVKNAQFAAGLLSKLRQEGEKYFVDEREVSYEQVQNMQTVVEEAVEIGLIQDPLILVSERSKLEIAIKEIWDQPSERFQAIASTYADLLLSDNFSLLVRERLDSMVQRDLDALRRDDQSLEQNHERERKILGDLVCYTQVLLKETRALGAELEASHLEVIRSICKVAMDPSLQTEEDAAYALTDAVRDMRPLFDDSFVAYLKYAVAEEEGRLARAGHLDDPEYNRWLFVLKIVQQGVYAELEKGIRRYIDHIMYVLRMETAQERRALLQLLIDVLPTLDVRPFVKVVDSIVGSLGDGVAGNFKEAMQLGDMTNKLLQLRRDVKELLPPERIKIMSKDADEWVAKQKEKLLKSRELSKQRLKAADETQHLEANIEALGRRGETERIE